MIKKRKVNGRWKERRAKGRERNVRGNRVNEKRETACGKKMGGDKETERKSEEKGRKETRKERRRKRVETEHDGMERWCGNPLNAPNRPDGILTARMQQR